MAASGRYDFLVVGAGLFGSTFASEAVRAGKRVLVIDRRNHIGGNCWSYMQDGIEVHAYGPHIIHTNDAGVWGWFSQFGELIPCIPAPLTMWRGHMYALPFSMYTFNQLWGVTSPDEAREVIESQRVPCENPRNLEEHVLDMVGVDIYERLVKGYTEKQYGKNCDELPVSLIARMPVTFEWDANYNGKIYQGVPAHGYGPIFEAMLDGAEVELGIDFLKEREALSALADSVVYTGAMDEYYGYRFGALEWRGRRFESRVCERGRGQGTALINYQDENVPQLRSIEHLHFVPRQIRPDGVKTVLTDEYAIAWEPGSEPFYTVNDEPNRCRFARYREVADSEVSVYFGGRLGEYRYCTMEDTVRSAQALARRILI